MPESREISVNGFSAQWQVLELNRNYPQYWLENNYDITNSVFGVRLLQTVDEYQKTLRTAKYALLIIALTFLSFFLCEVIARELFHPIHYSLIGFALIVFYLLVLSFSEHLGFDLAYIISSLATVIIISLYSLAIAKKKRTKIIVAAVLLILYTFIYTILQLEDYALLFGSIGLVLILSIIMYLTRKIDWFSLGDKSKTNSV